MEVIREAWGLQGRHKGKRVRREGIGGMWQESRIWRLGMTGGQLATREVIRESRRQ